MDLRKIERTVLMVSLIVGMLLFASIPLDASAAVTMTQSEKKALADKYSPVLQFNSAENVYPVNVTYYIARCDLDQIVGTTTTLIDPSPTAEKLGSYVSDSANYYLDDRVGTIHDSRIIDDYKHNESVIGYTIYSHVIQNSTGYIVQYWLFYVFNAGVYNDHEGDWEMVQVSLDSSQKPVSATYSQHEGGQTASWSDVDKEGDHMISYVAKGSHANYFRYYQGKMGPAMDAVDNGGKVLRASDYSVVVLGDQGAGNHPAWQNWIDFGGRWGSWGNATSDIMGQRGPPGPEFRLDGMMWDGSTFSASASSLETGTLPLEFLLYYFVYVVLALMIIPIVLMLLRVRKARKKGEFKKPYSSLLYIKGADARSISNVLVIIALVIGLLAAFLPYYEVFLNSSNGFYNTNGNERILLISGVDGIQINTLDPEGGIVQVGALPIPFAYLIALGVISFILSTIAREPKKVGRKYITRGIGFFIPLIFIVLFIGALGNMATSFGMPEGSDLIQQIISAISKGPIGGMQTLTTPDFGAVSISWGLGLGAWLMVVAGTMMIVAGILQILGRKNDSMKPGPAPQPGNQQPSQYQVSYDQPAPVEPTQGPNDPITQHPQGRYPGGGQQ